MLVPVEGARQDERTHAEALFSLPAFGAHETRTTRSFGDKDLTVYTLRHAPRGFVLQEKEQRLLCFRRTAHCTLVGELPAGLPVPPAPRLDPKQASNIAEDHLGLTPDDPRALSQTLELTPTGARPWYVVTALRNIEFERQLVRVRIEASTGALEDLPPPPPSALRWYDGLGSIYRFSPLDGPPVQDTLSNLTSLVDLRGSNIIVFNDDQSKPTAAGFNGQFVFPEGDKRIEMVMIYYYVDRIKAWFEQVFTFKPPSPTLLGYANVTQYRDQIVENNAAYLGVFDVPALGGNYPIIIFSESTGLYNSVMLSADIILHEFCHYVIDSLTGMGNEVTQNALHEGFADYFAAATTSDPHIGEYFVQKLENKDFLRNLDDTNRQYSDPLPATYRDPHVFGELFGQTMWEVRKTLLELLPARPYDEVTFVVDSLVYKTLQYFNRGTIDPRVFFWAFVDLDKNLWKGLHLAVILHTFYRRHFTLPGYEASYPTNLNPLNAQTMEASVGYPLPIRGESPLSAQFTTIAYAWRILSRPQGSNALIGQPLQREIRFTPDLPGRYVLEYVEAYNFYGISPPVHVTLEAGFGPPPPTSLPADPSEYDQSMGGCGLIRPPEVPTLRFGDR
ncbi:MAG: hypothetical protein A2284_17650 [Deltaproteobacteria bacterium RIFOXYA12_FULL_61_11]|nr:MAG: hypothetical protein A2284_17650 [Deltaproteobacteria bacterium RIFOXYA12_FULL_61_11]